MKKFIDYIDLVLEEREYHGQSGAGIIAICKKTKRVFLCQRSEDVLEPGKWSFPGGKIDDDDTNSWDAAVREFYEETLFGGPFRKHMLLEEFKDKNFSYMTYVAYVDREFDPDLNWESDDFGWFDINEFPSNIHFGLKRVYPKLKRFIEK
jgi:8-oxo-dGTP pyrophosphatase MutT (NUDIX family)